MPGRRNARRYARRLEAPLAAVTLLLVVVGLQSPPGWVDSWWAVGPVTLPAMSLYPVPLSLLVAGVGVATYRREGHVGARRLVSTGLAVLCLLSSAYAVVVLNTAPGGVFFAGLPPLVLGVLLCSVVVLGEAVAAGRRVDESAGS